MPTVTRYPQADLPSVLNGQAIAFMRVEWSFIFTGDNRFTMDTYPRELDPVHFVAAEGDALISYAAMLRLKLEHCAIPYIIAGFGNMFTFPPYRGEGYGQRVLALATDFIRQSSVDAGMLFCDTQLEPFYARTGWEAVAAPTYLGTPEHYEQHDVVKMMLFVSEKGKSGQNDFATQPLYIESPW